MLKIPMALDAKALCFGLYLIYVPTNADFDLSTTDMDFINIATYKFEQPHLS